MSYMGNTSDIEIEKNEFSRSRPTTSLISKMAAHKLSSEPKWTDKRDEDTDSEVSVNDNFLAKGAFLLTPSYELSMERAAMICEKMSFKGCFSLTKTATGILFKFSHPEDYQSIFKKGFHKVTGARFYRKEIQNRLDQFFASEEQQFYERGIMLLPERWQKIAIPCRPRKTFTLYVLDVPEDLPVEDIRHSLYRFDSVVEVVRIHVHHSSSTPTEKDAEGNAPSKPETVAEKVERHKREVPPAVIRVTLASMDEYNILLQNGLNFYDATFFPTEANIPMKGAKIEYKRRMLDGSIPGRVRELLPVFDAAGFCKIPPPASKLIKPPRS